MPKKLYYSDVYDFFLENECELLSKTYINNKSSLTYIASCGHKRTSTLDHIKRLEQFKCEKCTVIENKYFGYGIGMHPKTFEKTVKIMERLYDRTYKYRDDFLPENYDQTFTCWDCKKIKNRRLFPYRKQYKYNKEKRCKQCNIKNHQKRRDNHTHKQVIQTIITTSKASAKKRSKNGGRKECGIHKITIEDIEELYEIQEGKCALSGQELSFTYNDLNIISIDRIDSDKGYTKDNIQLTTSIVNQAKSNLSDEVFQEMCINVAENAGVSIPDEYKDSERKELYNAITKLEETVAEEREQYEIEQELYIKEIAELKKQISSLKEPEPEPKKRRPVIRLTKSKKVDKPSPPPIPKETTTTKLPDNLCIDCSEPILKESTRCNPCSNKFRFLQNKEGRPTYEQIMMDKAELKSFTALGKKYGKSDNAVRKWIKLYEKYM
jgi:hypothetical protein